MAAVSGDMARAMPQVIGTRAIITTATDELTVVVRRIMKPQAISTMPAATVRLARNRALSRGVSGATMIMIGAIGSRRSEVARAL